MWIHLLILLGVCYVVLSANPLCQRTASQACLIGEEDLALFPKNENELTDLCKFAKTTLECAVNFADTCGKNNFDLFNSNYAKVEKLMDAAADICKTSSPLYSRVVKALPCTNRVRVNDEELCRDRTLEGMAELQSVLENNKNADSEKARLHQLYRCLTPVLSANCFVSQTFKKCGSLAKDTVLEVMAKIGLLETSCLALDREEVGQLMEIAQFLTEEEIYVQQLIGRI